MEADCPNFLKVVKELEELAPGVPLLALGQTVFWDEPMKAGTVLALRAAGDARTFVAGIHDTDYFAKFESHDRRSGFKAFPHNDTTTKSLWSAAGEFSCLFGSETVVTKDKLAAAGGKLARVEHERPGYLDEITEAWGWRGVASLHRESVTIAGKKIDPLFRELFDTLNWAIDESLELVSGAHHQDSLKAKAGLLQLVCQVYEANSAGTLADFYEALLPGLYEKVAGQTVGMETTRTTSLLQFNSATAHQPRFDALRLFVEPKTRDQAKEAYDMAVRGSEIYTLDRFGTGAVPFDAVIPGIGRGTLRLGRRGGVIMASKPVGFSIKKPIETLEDLAAVLEAKFGPDVVIVGKAVTLITMLAREFVFLFHEGASSYVFRTLGLARSLRELQPDFKLFPILRVGYEPWDAMEDCCAWLKLPEPLQRPFGTSELSAPSFALRWNEVAKAQKKLLHELAQLRRPVELVRYLQHSIGGPWECLAKEHEDMHKELEGLAQRLADVRARKKLVIERLAACKADRQRIEHASGEHWRTKIFEKSPTDADWQERAAYQEKLAEIEHRRLVTVAEFEALQSDQANLVSNENLDRLRRRRGSIALEAELTRIRLIREAVVATEGLRRAGSRPSAWWFPLVCPDGTWFRSTMRSATARLEHLS